MLLSVATLDGGGDGGSEVRELKEWGGVRGDGLDEVLRGRVGAEEGGHGAVGEADGDEGVVQGEGEWCNFVLF